MYAAVLCLVWFEMLSFIPELIVELLSNIPFINFDPELGVGFLYAISAQKTLIFAVALMVVDHFAPIIPPARTEEVTELGERRARGDFFGATFSFGKLNGGKGNANAKHAKNSENKKAKNDENGCQNEENDIKMLDFEDLDGMSPTFDDMGK